MLMKMLAKKQGLTGNALKMIAIVTMLIDHMALVYMAPLAKKNGITKLNFTNCISSNDKYAVIYIIGRLIGRLSFLLFCFFLVEGFFHTRSRWKYVLRLSIFAIISEIPFDMGLWKKINVNHQNVFFTLVIGFVGIWICEIVRRKLNENVGLKYSIYDVTVYFTAVVVIAASVMSLLAEAIKCDYKMYGIITIFVIYYMKTMGADNTIAVLFGAIVLCISNSIEMSCLLCVPLVWGYKGKRGMNIKYFFYLFYPIHLALLYFYS